MKRELYVMSGPPSQWADFPPMGPYPSEQACRKAIKDDVDECLNSEDELSVGDDPNYSGTYTIVEAVKSYQPKVKVEASVSLSKLDKTPEDLDLIKEFGAVNFSHAFDIWAEDL